MTDWVTRIREVVFSPVRLGEAYDMDQVDYLLDLLEVAAAQGDPLGPVLEGIELNQVRLREGYSIPEVDAFFAEVRADGNEPVRLTPSARDQVQAGTPAFPSEHAPADPGPEPGPGAGSAASSEAGPEPAPVPDPAADRPGFFRRLFGRR